MLVNGKQTNSLGPLCEALQDCPISLRWGGPLVEGALNGRAHLLNGLEQLQAFTKAGVPTVRYTTNRAEAEQWCQQPQQIVFGRNLNHTQGRDIVLPSHRLWRTKDFWTVYQPAEQEWRVHICLGRSIARGMKVFVPEEAPRNHPLVPMGRAATGERVPTGQWQVRSRRLGWRISHSREELGDTPEIVRSTAKLAVAAVGYELGAVDLLYSPSTGAIHVLEVNSRPAIRDEYTVRCYSDFLRRVEEKKLTNRKPGEVVVKRVKVRGA